MPNARRKPLLFLLIGWAIGLALTSCAVQPASPAAPSTRVPQPRSLPPTRAPLPTVLSPHQPAPDADETACAADVSSGQPSRSTGH